jgi:hypothetical protein
VGIVARFEAVKRDKLSERYSHVSREVDKRTMIRPKRPLGLAIVGILLAGCAQPQAPVQPVPPGPSPAEIADYAAAQAQNRRGHAIGNNDDIAQALYSFRQISAQILARQDPKLFDAYDLCQSYRVAGPRGGLRIPSHFEPQFVRPCDRIEWRYGEETAAIRSDLEARIAAADRATMAQAAAGHP